MLTAKIKVEINSSAIKKIEESAEKSMLMLGELFLTEIESAQVVPMDTGMLKDSVQYYTEGFKLWIGWNTPYARRLYFHPEYNFKTDKHVNAQGLWLNPWKFGNRKEWLPETLLKLIKLNSGGIVE